jgi:hypothetical protein
MMTIEEIYSWLQQNIVAVVSILLVAVQIYLVYRIDRAKLKLEKFMGITEKFGLLIRPKARGVSEVIVLSNNGIVPVEEIHAILEITLHRKDEPEKSLRLEWVRKQVLNSKEEAVLPLYEKLREYLIMNKFIRTHEVTIPSGEIDDITEDYIYVTTSVSNLAKRFDATLDLEVKAKIEGQTKTIKKKFKLEYDYRPEVFLMPPPPELEYEDDYIIRISEHMGEWKT